MLGFFQFWFCYFICWFVWTLETSLRVSFLRRALVLFCYVLQLVSCSTVGFKTWRRPLVVQRVDNAIHRTNLYSVDSVVCFANTYPLDSDLSGGSDSVIQHRTTAAWCEYQRANQDVEPTPITT